VTNFVGWCLTIAGALIMAIGSIFIAVSIVEEDSKGKKKLEDIPIKMKGATKS
jgi:hypothetical protein